MSHDATKLPGYYRDRDGARVPQSEAIQTWATYAFDELLSVARQYGGFVTYKALALKVQDLSGVRTRVLITHWIGKVLEEVAIRAKADGEPPITSLCVMADGTIGDGYARAPRITDDEPGDDIELFAARHRLLCYQKYATDLPSDGGSPALTPAVRKARLAREAHMKPVVDEPRPCPTCFIQVSVAGECGCG
ncbi:hypothetical protein [Salinibacterium sp. ZJ70]|uniref:hypothetical protein n=1 Tax=Salinibacterium sp. ZJ70 TaxID=2708084 RepID=UPI00141FDA55|nr:hypothetical protein [Salinibacterium sp. ZJ70]